MNRAFVGWVHNTRIKKPFQDYCGVDEIFVAWKKNQKDDRFVKCKITIEELGGKKKTEKNEKVSFDYVGISQCPHCFCITKTIKGKCGKCGGKKK